MKTFIVIGLIIALAFAAPPIPAHPDGYTFTAANTKKLVRLDVYEDLLCIDCKHFHPGFAKYLNTEKIDGVPVSEYIESVVHIFPLPYHHHAFFAAELVPFIFDLNKDESQVFEYADWIFSVQDEFNSGSVTLSQPQVQAKLCSEASAALDFLDEAACLNEFSSHNFDNDARVSWKLAAYNGVTGTPTVFLNGVEIEAPLTTAEWRATLKPYLTTSKSVLADAIHEISQ